MPKNAAQHKSSKNRGTPVINTLQAAVLLPTESSDIGPMHDPLSVKSTGCRVLHSIAALLWLCSAATFYLHMPLFDCSVCICTPGSMTILHYCTTCPRLLLVLVLQAAATGAAFS